MPEPLTAAAGLLLMVIGLVGLGALGAETLRASRPPKAPKVKRWGIYGDGWLWLDYEDGQYGWAQDVYREGYVSPYTQTLTET